MNVFEMNNNNNNNVVDNAVDPSMLLISNYNIYDVINNYDNIVNVNVNSNFNDTFIYDDHNYYDDDFNGDNNNEAEDDESPDVDGANNNTSNNNIKNRNHLKNTKLSKKRRSLNHLHVKFHEVDDSINNYHQNIINNSNTCSSNNYYIANIGNNNNYNCDNNANITAVVATDHDTSTTTSSTPPVISTTTATSTAATTNPTSNTPTTTISTTATTNDDNTSYIMSTATPSFTTTTTNDDEISSYMYHGRLWTEEMDQELSSLHSTYKLEKDWAQKITNLINLKFHTTLTSSQISKRWTQYVRPELLKRKVGLWSETEIKQLHELVFKNSYESRNIKGMIVVHWENVALALNRRYNDCQNKWNTIKKSTLKGIYVYLDIDKTDVCFLYSCIIINNIDKMDVSIY